MGDSLSPSDQRKLSNIMMELQRLREDARSPSSPGQQPPQPPNFVKEVTQTAHGWVAGQVVVNTTALDDNGWALADQSDTGNTDDQSVIGIIGKVKDANTLLIVIAGVVCLKGFTEFETYYLVQPPGSMDKVKPPTGKVRAVMETLGDGMAWVLCNSGGGNLADLSDVKLATLADGDIIKWNNTDGKWENTSVVASFGVQTKNKVFAGPLTGADAAPTFRLLSLVDFPTQAAASVLANGLGTIAVPTAIAATADGQVFQRSGTLLAWGQVVTAGIADLNVTTIKIANASVTAAKLGSDVFLTALKDVNISSQVDYEVPVWDAASSKWIRRNIGRITYVPASVQMAFDGGVGGTATHVGIAAVGSRLLLGGAAGATALDFFLNVGGLSTANDKNARILVNATNIVTFYDQATGLTGVANGDKVMDWTCSATAASRSFKFRQKTTFTDQTDTAGGGSQTLALWSDTASTWYIDTSTNNTRMLTFYDDAGSFGVGSYIKIGASLDTGLRPIYFNGLSGSVSIVPFSGTLVQFNAPLLAINGRLSASIDTGQINVATNGSIYFCASGSPIFSSTTTYIQGTLSVSIPVLAFTVGGTQALSMTYTATGITNTFGPTGTVNLPGLATFKNISGVYTMGVFGATPVSQQADIGVSSASNAAGAAGISYSQAVANNTIADARLAISQVNNIRSLLRAYGFMA